MLFMYILLQGGAVTSYYMLLSTHPQPIPHPAVPKRPLRVFFGGGRLPVTDEKACCRGQ